ARPSQCGGTVRGSARRDGGAPTGPCRQSRGCGLFSPAIPLPWPRSRVLLARWVSRTHSWLMAFFRRSDRPLPAADREQVMSHGKETRVDHLVVGGEQKDMGKVPLHFGFQSLAGVQVDVAGSRGWVGVRV